MTLTTRPPVPPVSDGAEALFPEARRRRRRIRLTVGVSILGIAVVTAGVVWAIGRGSGSPTPPSSGPSDSLPAQISAGTIIHSSLAVRSAREEWRTVTSYPGCNPPMSALGVLDLAHARSAVTVSSPGCRSGDGTYSQRGTFRSVQIGTAVYRTRQPQEVWPYGPGKSWFAGSPNQQAGLLSARPLNVLTAVSGPFMRVGATDIRGVPTAEYVDSATLASLRGAIGIAGAGVGTPDPPLKQIPIQIAVWIDGQHRVRQISTWEPYYTQNYTNGASQGGPYITPWSSSGGSPDAPPRQQGFIQMTLDLWQFGVRIHVTAPPASTVARPH